MQFQNQMLKENEIKLSHFQRCLFGKHNMPQAPRPNCIYSIYAKDLLLLAKVIHLFHF